MVENKTDILSGDLREMGRRDEDLTDNQGFEMVKSINKYECLDLLCLVDC